MWNSFVGFSGNVYYDVKKEKYKKVKERVGMRERSHSLCMADYGGRRGWKMRMESAGKERDMVRHG